MRLAEPMLGVQQGQGRVPGKPLASPRNRSRAAGRKVAGPFGSLTKNTMPETPPTYSRQKLVNGEGKSWKGLWNS